MCCIPEASRSGAVPLNLAFQSIHPYMPDIAYTFDPFVGVWVSSGSYQRVVICCLCVNYVLLSFSDNCILQREFNGVFATHQHALFNESLGLFQQLKHTVNWCIDPGQQSSQADAASLPETDFLIGPGVNRTSLAFHVASREVRAEFPVPFLILERCVCFKWMLLYQSVCHVCAECMMSCAGNVQGVPDTVINTAQLWKSRLEKTVLAFNSSIENSHKAALSASSNLDSQQAHPRPAQDAALPQRQTSARQLNTSGSESPTLAGASSPTSQCVHLHTFQAAKLPSSLRSIGKSLPAALAASSFIPVKLAPTSTPSNDFAPPLHPTIPAEFTNTSTNQNGGAGSARSFAWAQQPSEQAWGATSCVLNAAHCSRVLCCMLVPFVLYCWC